MPFQPPQSPTLVFSTPEGVLLSLFLLCALSGLPAVNEALLEPVCILGRDNKDIYIYHLCSLFCANKLLHCYWLVLWPGCQLC